ncbi:hypothetical protein BC939DRAFT_463378 [Gamsiella multidivaricata]|uniref:uncharacterized protein n=1 Tax=Gamsiella multidivaricata TaxID=101098 RepID=UPI00221EF0A5|nr:uncharacterized protein BC939DRAFT_463378 [Gamsiella multidivaricata]KAI7818351.1 hypothetical protein BC939DRAFT_463378 [Gamsiella multidivaricata]
MYNSSFFCSVFLFFSFLFFFFLILIPVSLCEFTRERTRKKKKRTREKKRHSLLPSSSPLHSDPFSLIPPPFLTFCSL